jgi:hypothetical protein
MGGDGIRTLTCIHGFIQPIIFEEKIQSYLTFLNVPQLEGQRADL